MERWRLSGDLEEGDLEDLDDVADDVEAIEDEEVDPDEGPLPSDSDLGWEREGLLTDHEPYERPGWNTTLYVVGALALFAMLAPLIVILLF
ncbi:MAG TPA: hypothetical protein VFO84_03270 [Dehalococcoidia bacterium]|nr:hypothetical protein [Dehalococcoidia bacterium]